MKELYTSPVAELISFVAMENLATNTQSKIPYNDEMEHRQVGNGGESLVPNPF